MTSVTRLDAALAAMDAAPEEAGPRLAFHERLADAELFLLLEREAEAGHAAPRVFETDDGRFVAAFDLEERLAAFAGAASPFASMPGRVLARLAADQGLGLALNLGVANGETLVGAEALAWLAGIAAARPEAAEARLRDVAPPGALPERLLTALDAKLAAMPGRARHAYLAAVTYDSGAPGHLLAFVDAAPGAEDALAAAIAETLAFSGLDAAALDVLFLAAHDPVAGRLARVGLRFDLPAPQSPPAPAAPSAPGSDPDRPPILRSGPGVNKN